MYTYGRKQGCRISLDYTYKGMQIAYLENELIRVGVLLDKGADIFEFTYKPCDLDMMWQSPIPMRSQFISTSALSEGTYHDYYYGGWQEILPSAGWSSEPYLGTYQGLHGEVSLLPFEAQIVEDDRDRVTLKTKVSLHRSPLSLERNMTLKTGQAVLFIEETLTNHSASEFAIMWGHHPALGEPFLDDSCVVQVPATTVEAMAFHPNGLWEPDIESKYPLAKNRRTGQLQDITKVLDRTSKSVDVLFLKELTDGWLAITNQRQQVGFGMAWDKELFKYVWMWQNYGGHNDYPWYGRAYTCAVEPFTSYPPQGIANAIKNGTALFMQPEQVIHTQLVAAAYQGDGVKSIGIDGEIKQ
jgi:hypothetical protein